MKKKISKVRNHNTEKVRNHITEVDKKWLWAFNEVYLQWNTGCQKIVYN